MYKYSNVIIEKSSCSLLIFSIYVHVQNDIIIKARELPTRRALEYTAYEFIAGVVC